MDYTNTHDKKIMEFDISKGYEAFIKLFTDDELNDMRKYIAKEFCYSVEELSDVGYRNNDNIIIEYVKQWMIDNIYNMTYDGTEQLYKILFEM